MTPETLTRLKKDLKLAYDENKLSDLQTLKQELQAAQNCQTSADFKQRAASAVSEPNTGAAMKTTKTSTHHP